MRCHKCGYLSFDYLSECKMCKVDLTTARESLGILNIAAPAPLFLNSMLKNTQTLPVEEGEAFENGESFVMDLPEIEFEEEQTFDGAMPDLGNAGQAQPKREDKIVAGAGEDSSGVFFKDLENELTIELTDEDLSNVFQEAEPQSGPDLKVDPSLKKTVEAEQTGSVRHEAGKAAHNKDAVSETQVGQIPDDDLAIDLGDEDLEELLMELEEAGPAKTAAPGADQSITEKPGTKGKKS
ncbi:MAG: hypothetical protein AB2L11_11790 [Syntrophobacteraceae bacterium]